MQMSEIPLKRNSGVIQFQSDFKPAFYRLARGGDSSGSKEEVVLSHTLRPPTVSDLEAGGGGGGGGAGRDRVFRNKLLEDNHRGSSAVFFLPQREERLYPFSFSFGLRDASGAELLSRKKNQSVSKPDLSCFHL